MKQNKIGTMQFGNTGHSSTRALFGAASLASVSQSDADRTMELLIDYGVNHIDTARSYGDAELRLGPWMKRARDEFFLATKSGARTKSEARRELEESLERLQTDHIDLWQFHCLVDPFEWETAMGEGGILEAAIEAREQGLISYIGVTGHGITTAQMHMKSLERFEFDSVLLPYNYLMMNDPVYAQEFNQLLKVCSERKVAVQTIKSIARKTRTDRHDGYSTWYEPLSDSGSIAKTVTWVLQNEQIFLNTPGDITLLPHVLKAASERTKPSPEEMASLVDTERMQQLFTIQNNNMVI